MAHGDIPRTLMERMASLERRVAELERELRATRRVGVIPTSLRVVNPHPEHPWDEPLPPPLMPMPHLGANNGNSR